MYGGNVPRTLFFCIRMNPPYDCGGRTFVCSTVYKFKYGFKTLESTVLVEKSRPELCKVSSNEHN